MKIIYLHQYFLTPQMPGGTRSYEMARRLVAAGHDVHMITTDQSGGAHGWRVTHEAGIRVHWASVRYNNEMSFMRRIAAFASFAIKSTMRAMRLQADVVFATSTPLTVALPALVVSWWRRIPFVFEVRDLWPDVPIAIGAIRNPMAAWAARRLELLTYRTAARVVALAPGMRDDIVAKGIPAEKICVIPNGCDLDLFAEAKEGPSPRAEHPWLGSRKMVLFAGTLGLVNGVDYLVRLAKRTRESDPEIRFVVIGGGRERNEIRKLAEDAGILGVSFFMLEPVPKLELIRWMKAADLIVALFTGPPAVWKHAVQNKFFDALAAGKPVANNFDGWQSRIAVDAGVGVILDSNDIDRAAQTVIQCLHDAQWLAEVPERARRLASGPFSRDLLASQLEHVLAEAVSGA